MCLTVELNEDLVFKIPEAYGNINFGGCELGKEHSWSKGNAIPVSLNYLESTVSQSCLSAGLRRLETQFDRKADSRAMVQASVLAARRF